MHCHYGYLWQKFKVFWYRPKRPLVVSRFLASPPSVPRIIHTSTVTDPLPLMRPGSDFLSCAVLPVVRDTLDGAGRIALDGRGILRRLKLLGCP